MLLPESFPKKDFILKISKQYYKHVQDGVYFQQICILKIHILLHFVCLSGHFVSWGIGGGMCASGVRAAWGGGIWGGGIRNLGEIIQNGRASLVFYLHLKYFLIFFLHDNSQLGYLLIKIKSCFACGEWISSQNVKKSKILWDHWLSTYAEFFLLLDTHRCVFVSGGNKYWFFGKFYVRTKWIIPMTIFRRNPV